jgi:prolyl oligopeptidase
MSAISVFILAASLGPVEAKPADNNPASHGYPNSQRVDQVDTYHGVTVPDPYRWLEADVRQSADVQAWVSAQNAATEAYLAAIPQREQIRRRLTQLWNYPKHSPPTQRKGKYFFNRNDGLQNQSVFFVADGLHAPARMLLDPNTWSQDGTVALASAEPNRDGTRIAYTVSDAGSDWKTLKVLNVATGANESDQLKWLRSGSVHWTDSGDGFYYGRFPQPAEAEQYQSLPLNHAIYFHKLGTPQEHDVLIYRRPDHPEWTFAVTLTEDQQYLVLEVHKSTDDKNQVFVRRTDQSEWTEVIGDFENQFTFVGNRGKTFYFLSDLAAPNRRVVAIDMDAPERTAIREVVPAASDALDAVSLVNGQLIAKYLKDAITRVRIFSLEGSPVRDVEFPGPGTASGFAGRQDDTETFYSFSSYTTPPGIYRYDLIDGTSTIWQTPPVDVAPEQFETEQVFYPSRDGTRIPMILACRKGLPRDGNRPTLLFGYGGFNISITPQFSPAFIAWMEMGGMLAVANLRGGGEYGEDWHLAGKTLKKQNVFDDFIAAADWLIAEKYTRTQRLAIQGRSNGGLLVGAVMTQRPDLFGACLPAVGVMDMLRYHRFTAGRYWVDEYGSVDQPDQFAALIKYSPYHNLQPGNYPPTLISTADTDDRVVPMHSFKFAAALQYAQRGTAPVLIRIETRAGHGSGTPTSKLIDNIADHWAFLVKSLNMELEAAASSP